MANKYGIVRLDRVSGTPDGRLKAKVDLENGQFVVQDEVNGELKLPAAVTDRVVLVASVCHQYESMNEGDFINKAGSKLKPRTYEKVAGDIFTVTAIGYTGGTSPRADFNAIQVGDKGHVQPSGKLVFYTAADATAYLTVEVIGKTKLNGDNAVQVKVLK
ncbi:MULTISPECIES: hypothetical protein [unclassified Paenibacillus]|uniref:hypothetical protein n=1 Tax=unclassified Paenibacillus TaxID=185978 RepID=UPI00034E369E|nr:MULTISPECIES: hypothetical protein [unclassified Paenibacillus]EPD82017.1 hypothetical protein HMPREF1207_03843 [Paenibacillus sp. HGH0039]